MNGFFRLGPILKTDRRPGACPRQDGPAVLAAADRKRVFFAAGLVLFFIGMYLLSSLVWSIDVQGNSKFSEEQILQAAKAEGIYPFQWSFRSETRPTCRGIWPGSFPGRHGSASEARLADVRVVESSTPDDKPLMSPRHLVARERNLAVVTKVMAESGRPLVEDPHARQAGRHPHLRASRGTTSGKAVVAKGEVKGLVWHE